jgi:type II secretory pathway component PulK
VKHLRQRGIALLVAIVMFAIATTVAAAITYNKAMAARRAAATFTLEQALQAGMAAEGWPRWYSRMTSTIRKLRYIANGHSRSARWSSRHWRLDSGAARGSQRAL